jgi:hypothetical protein
VARDRDRELEAGNEVLSEFIAVMSVCRRRSRWARTLGARPRVHGGGRSPREPFREEHVGRRARRTSMRGARPSGGSKRELVRRAGGGVSLNPLDATKSTSASYGRCSCSGWRTNVCAVALLTCACTAGIPGRARDVGGARGAGRRALGCLKKGHVVGAGRYRTVPPGPAALRRLMTVR